MLRLRKRLAEISIGIAGLAASACDTKPQEPIILPQGHPQEVPTTSTPKIKPIQQEQPKEVQLSDNLPPERLVVEKKTENHYELRKTRGQAPNIGSFETGYIPEEAKNYLDIHTKVTDSDGDLEELLLEESTDENTWKEIARRKTEKKGILIDEGYGLYTTFNITQTTLGTYTYRLTATDKYHNTDQSTITHTFQGGTTDNEPNITAILFFNSLWTAESKTLGSLVLNLRTRDRGPNAGIKTISVTKNGETIFTQSGEENRDLEKNIILTYEPETTADYTISVTDQGNNTTTEKRKIIYGKKRQPPREGIEETFQIKEDWESKTCLITQGFGSFPEIRTFLGPAFSRTDCTATFNTFATDLEGLQTLELLESRDERKTWQKIQEHTLTGSYSSPELNVECEEETTRYYQLCVEDTDGNSTLSSILKVNYQPEKELLEDQLPRIILQQRLTGLHLQALDTGGNRGITLLTITNNNTPIYSRTIERIADYRTLITWDELQPTTGDNIYDIIVKDQGNHETKEQITIT